MDAILNALQSVLDNPQQRNILVELVIVGLSYFITYISYLGNRYVSSSASQRKMQALGSAVKMAVDRVESLDKGGAFKGLGADEKGAQKREMGYTIIRETLKRSGWTLKDDKEANKILEDAVNADLHQRYGVVLPVKQYCAAASKALETVLMLQTKGQLKAPEGTDPRVYLVEVAASRLIAELGKDMVAITPENATAWVHDALITHQLGLTFPVGITQPSAVQLSALVAEAAEYLTRLRAAGESSIKLAESEAGADIDRYMITAWLLTEAARRRLNVSTTDIGDAASKALDAFRAGMAVGAAGGAPTPS